MEPEIKWVLIMWAVIVSVLVLGSAYENYEETIQMSACVNAGGQWLSNKDTGHMECVRKGN